ncbi:hypothetical protein [Actinomadura latina]|uniref:Lipoprotein n=1 Tax=Actinomadura latina TaxID=163603 RepID=A0A846Z6M4_9ACTN|nr:hypothetical protein [Actinomadura latina]NKZ06892.1 hypothetical protein [Actinomadura latina]
MSHHRLRAGHVSAALVLVLASATACGPAEDAATTSKTGSAPAARPSGAASDGATAAAPNGVEKLPAAGVLSRARKATAAARFLRMRGNIEDGKDKFALDFRYAGRTKATGWFQQGKQRVEITRIGKDVYLKGNNAFWKAIGGKGAVQLFSGKQLKTTTRAADFKDLAGFTDRTAIFNEAVKSVGTWKTAGTGTVGGTPAVRLTGAPGEEIHVATRGAPYVLRVDGGPGNRIEYLDYGKPVDVRRPPAGTVVDGDAFQ